MEGFLLAASAVIPLLIYMLIGAGIRRTGMFSHENFKALNGLLFRLFIPLALFRDVYRADLAASFQADFFTFVGVGILIMLVCSWLVGRRVSPIPADQATITQGMFRSNYVLLGGAIAAALCDDAGVALAAALASLSVPLFNGASVIIFELNRGGEVKPLKLLRNIMKNPILDAGLLGTAMNLLHVPVPELVLEPLSKLGSAATPVALVTLGGLLSLGSMRSHRRELMTATLFRLVLFPAVFLGAAGLMGWRGNELIVLMALFASPTAVASGPMAQVMGGNGALAGEIVAVTSTLCMATLFLFIMTMSNLGWIG